MKCKTLSILLILVLRHVFFSSLHTAHVGQLGQLEASLSAVSAVGHNVVVDIHRCLPVAWVLPKPDLRLQALAVFPSLCEVLSRLDGILVAHSWLRLELWSRLDLWVGTHHALGHRLADSSWLADAVVPLCDMLVAWSKFAVLRSSGLRSQVQAALVDTTLRDARQLTWL